ncbi:MAG: 16S rRNA (uracil(1498)-N(3))-methyltransferase [Treponema sp.]|nr:16S rRNA (uracil(1498)-N(3))-methyltransferase [Treponema sp.]
MKQFILNNEPDSDNVVELKSDDYRYLVKVRRLAAGEFFPALLPNGTETSIQIISIENNILTGRCIFPNDSSSQKNSASSVSPCLCVRSLPELILFQALPKGDKMDLIVRQAAEGGLSEIVPFVSEFSVAKKNTGGQKVNRWEKIIKEARQQSGSKIATTLHKTLSKSELLNYWQTVKKEGALGLVFHHQKVQNGVLEQKSLHEYLNDIPRPFQNWKVVLVIGPEGGFSEKEVSLFMENDFKPFTFGDTVLRTETAALYCAAAIRILLLEKDSWELKKT